MSDPSRHRAPTTAWEDHGPTENAQPHHDELVPGHISTPAETDPELIECFDFAFDEVVGTGNSTSEPG